MDQFAVFIGRSEGLGLGFRFRIWILLSDWFFKDSDVFFRSGFRGFVFLGSSGSGGPVWDQVSRDFGFLGFSRVRI